MIRLNTPDLFACKGRDLRCWCRKGHGSFAKLQVTHLSEKRPTSESCSLWSLGKTSKPSLENCLLSMSMTCFWSWEVVIFCNQTFSPESWRDLDSVFTFYIVLQQLGSEWVMFVAICQPRFGKVLWSVGRGYTWFCLAMLTRFMDSLHGCSSFFCCESMWGRLYGNLWCSWYSMVLL